MSAVRNHSRIAPNFWRKQDARRMLRVGFETINSRDADMLNGAGGSVRAGGW
jgi:hypothetical protein